MNFIAEIWNDYRPYGIKIAVDFLIAASIYVALFLFQVLRLWLPISGWGALFIDNIHSAGSVAALFIFSIFLVIDILRIYIRRK